jgi:hypothetical protein
VAASAVAGYITEWQPGRTVQPLPGSGPAAAQAEGTE